MLLQGKRVDLPQLAAELTAAGVSHRQLGITGDDLHTYDAGGASVDVPAGAAAVLAGHTPPPVPASPVYGADLLTDDQIQQQAAVLVTQLRQYIGLTTPSAAQRKAWEDGMSKIAIYLIRQRFPNL